MINTFARKMIEAELGWGYFSDSTTEKSEKGKDGELLALIFFERPEQEHYDPSHMLNHFSGMIKLMMDYGNISSRLSWEDSVMKSQVGKKGTQGILHMYGSQESPQAKDALVKLIESQINYSSIGSYCQEHEGHTERIECLVRSGFKRKKDFVKEESDMLVFDHLEEKSPRLAVFEYHPPIRVASDYQVPLVQSPPVCSSVSPVCKEKKTTAMQS